MKLPPSMHSAYKREILLQVPLFRALTPAELDAISARASTQAYPRGSTILRKGDPATGMIVILQGRVRIGLVSDEGKEVTLRVLGAGEVLGEISFLDGEERSADVTALEDCVALNVERAHFLSLLHGSSDLCLRLMKTLCQRIRRTSLSLEEAISLDLPTRLGRHLLRMAQDYGIPTPRGTRIGLRMSQGEIAALVGVSREKVNRQLRSWKSEGVIATDQGYLVMLRPEQLRRPSEKPGKGA
jgi:CRP/FNR family cyclic AMP-dependent transcriptional regulator